MITRQTALSVMYSKLQEIDSESLANMLEDFPESYFRNYQVVDRETMDLDDDEEYPMLKIRTLNDF